MPHVATGRCAETLHAFVMDHVEPGSTIITDGWPAYQGLAQLGYEHSAQPSGESQQIVPERCSSQGFISEFKYTVIMSVKFQ